MRSKILLIVICLLFATLLKSQSDYLTEDYRTEWLSNHFESEFYKTHFTGFYLYDPATKETLASYNGEKLFIPASNVKILTLYGAMKALPDSLPAIKYERKNGDLYIEGYGDPTFLHPKFKSHTKVLDFLKNESGNIYLYWGNFEGTRLGLGWSWEDYDKYFSPERSEFPLYGNMATIKKNRGGPSAFPMALSDSIEYQESIFNRDFYDNKFYLGSRNGASATVPFVAKDELIRRILSDVIGKEVFLTDQKLSRNAKTLFSLPSDLVYKRMMEVSDNFLAEQLLLMVSAQVSSSMSSAKAINYLESKYLKGFLQKPVWVDGSGLSRYNLFSPRDMVYVLEKLYTEFPESRLFNTFAIGGRTGTLKRNYGGKRPYVYAKSGTLSNNYALSGYLVTESGKTLIFSLMNNHFTKENWQVRQETQKVLEFVRDNY